LRKAERRKKIAAGISAFGRAPFEVQLNDNLKFDIYGVAA